MTGGGGGGGGLSTGGLGGGGGDPSCSMSNLRNGNGSCNLTGHFPCRLLRISNVARNFKKLAVCIVSYYNSYATRQGRRKDFLKGGGGRVLLNETF